jgi:hypothetical protein
MRYWAHWALGGPTIQNFIASGPEFYGNPFAGALQGISFGFRPPHRMAK